MPASKTEQRKVAIEWMGLSTKERFDRALPLNDSEMRKSLPVGKTVWNKWVDQFHEQHKRDLIMKCHPMVVGEKPKEVEVIPEEYDSEKYLNDHVDKVDEALIEACDQNNAQALKIYYQLTKRLVERTEVKIGLTADEITRRNLEAERQLREGGYRVAEV